MIVGLDIGYSNLKVCFGTSNKDMSKHVFPVGVVIDDRRDGLRGTTPKGSEIVKVDEQQYIACLSPSDIALDYQRVLLENYPETIEYKALLHASLIKTKSSVIDLIVTGLPVDQFITPGKREALTQLIKGTHEVFEGVFVEVKDVIVVPQPLGSYSLETSSNDDLLDSLVLVLDPGFFSVDWAVMQDGNLLRGALGTSKLAISSIYEEAVRLIRNETGGRTNINMIEKAIVHQREYIKVFGERVQLTPFLEQATVSISSNIKKELESVLRKSNIDIDYVLLTGGGSMLYKNIAKEMFPHSKTITTNEYVLSNAKGFYQIAKDLRDE